MINKKPLTDSQLILKKVLLEELHQARRKSSVSYCRVAAHNTSKRTGFDYEKCFLGTQRLTAGGKIGCENPHYPFYEV